MKGLRCYRCGHSLESLSPPLSRLDLCPGCGVELHVCRMCTSYAPNAPDACTEEDAIEVRDKTTANFCDYFEPSPNAFDRAGHAADQRAREALASLFDRESGSESDPAGGAESAGDPALDAANALFKK